MPSINNLLKGFQDGLPGMKDYQHASRLYLDDNFKLMPKQKFLFHVVFHTDETLFVNGFSANEREYNGMMKIIESNLQSKLDNVWMKWDEKMNS